MNSDNQNMIKERVKTHLRTMYLLEDEQADQMLTIAVKTITRNIADARDALKNTEFQKLGDAAHSIKGSLLNLGLNEEAQTAKEIEFSVKERVETDFHKLLLKLNDSLTGLLEETQ